MVCPEKQGVEEVDDNTIPTEAADKQHSVPTDFVTEVGHLNNNTN